MSKATYRKTIAKAMRLARTAARKTQADVAAVLGLSQVQVSRLEAGAHPWTVEAMRQACDFYGVRMSDVLAVAQTSTIADGVAAA